jgi:hypothetical protein
VRSCDPTDRCASDVTSIQREELATIRPMRTRPVDPRNWGPVDTGTQSVGTPAATRRVLSLPSGMTLNPGASSMHRVRGDQEGPGLGRIGKVRTGTDPARASWNTRTFGDPGVGREVASGSGKSVAGASCTASVVYSTVLRRWSVETKPSAGRGTWSPRGPVEPAP